MENRYKIQYDIKLKNVTNITFKQGDIDSSVLDITLLDNGQVIDLTGETIEFRFLKSDKKIVFQDTSAGVKIIDAVNGNVECVLKANTLAAVGDVTCEMHRVKDGKTLTTQGFVFTVEESISGDGILSENYISTIDGMLISMQQAEAVREINEADRIALYNEISTKLANDEFKGDKGDKGDTGERGIQGEKGDTGVVPNIQIGNVTTLQAGNPATVTRQPSSPDTAPIFDFGIPKGIDGAGAGDMTKVDYDTNNDGKVNSADVADTLTGLTSSIAEIDSAVDNAHTHSNKTVLDLLSEYDGKLSYNGSEIGNAKSVEYTKVTLPKVISTSMTCSGIAEENIITLGSSSYGLEVGDKIAIQNAGVKKNNSVFMLRTTTLPTSNGNVTITINNVDYILAVTTSDTASTIADKIYALNLPYTFILSADYILYDTGSTESTTITFNFGSTGAVITSEIDNTINYNYHRTVITNIDGTTVTIQDNLIRTVSNVTLKLDHTDLVQDALDNCVNTNNRIYFEAGTYNVFDKLNLITDTRDFQLYGDGESSIIDCVGIVGIYTPYWFANYICYYTDGQLFNFLEGIGITFKNISMHGQYQAGVVLNNCQDVLFENCNFEWLTVPNMDNAIICVYTKEVRKEPKNYVFNNCKFKMGMIALIFKSTDGGSYNDNPIHNVKIQNCIFELNEIHNFTGIGKEWAEMNKFDSKTYDVEIEGCIINNASMSAFTITQGNKNIYIHDNIFESTTSRFINFNLVSDDLDVCENIKVYNNTFKNYTYAIYFTEAFDSNTIARKYIHIYNNTAYNGDGAFALMRNCSDIYVDDNVINDAENNVNQIIIIADANNVHINRNTIKSFNSQTIMQMYILRCSNIFMRENVLSTLQLNYVTNGNILHNSILCRTVLLNNYSVNVLYNELNVNDELPDGWDILSIISNDEATNSGVYNVFYNKLFTTKSVNNIVTSGTMTVNKGYNVYPSESVINYTFNPISLADGEGVSSSGIYVVGANFGDFVLVSAPYSLTGLICTAYVANTNYVQIRLQNETGGTVDLADGVWKIKVIKF